MALIPKIPIPSVKGAQRVPGKTRPLGHHPHRPKIAGPAGPQNEPDDSLVMKSIEAGLGRGPTPTPGGKFGL